VWPVGTWSLKGHWYEDLRREGASAGHEVDPPGSAISASSSTRFIFGRSRPSILAEERNKGRVRKVWLVRGKEDNHFSTAAFTTWR
jgi:hypothetical protein